MWIRKRFDIPDLDLAWAVGRCLVPGRPARVLDDLAQVWDSDSLLPVLSVRSGFDLLLSVAGWRAGDEIILSGLTIPDMPRIVRENGLVPVGVEVSESGLAPLPGAIEAAVTPRTRAVVVAHLFGGLTDLDGIAATCRRHGLMLIEDCAQSWIGNHLSGDPRAEVSMYSFGPIKTNTALAGGVFEIRNRSLLAGMRTLHQSWPVQSRTSFFRRLSKYELLKKLATRPGLATISRVAQAVGSSHDCLVSGAARGFPGPGFFRKIRRQPSVPLLELLHRRLLNFDPETIRARQNCGQALAARLARRFPVPGISSLRQTWWVLSILVDDPEPLVKQLWKAGFDATRACSLRPVGDLPIAKRMLEHMVILPFDLTMPAGELDRMIRLILDSPAQAPGWASASPTEHRIGQHCLTESRLDPER